MQLVNMQLVSMQLVSMQLVSMQFIYITVRLAAVGKNAQRTYIVLWLTVIGKHMKHMQHFVADIGLL